MHELSLCESIARSAITQAGGRAVERVEVKIGQFHNVVPESLEFCWAAVTDGGDLDGCQLGVDYVPAVVVCRTCAVTSTLEGPALACGECASADVEIVSGDELAVVALHFAGQPNLAAATEE